MSAEVIHPFAFWQVDAVADIVALLIPLSGCGTPSPARCTTVSAWFPDCFSRLDL